MNSAPVKASTALVFASFVQKGAIVLSVPFFTRLMTTSDYGAFSVYASWIEVIGLVASLCLSKGVYNNGLQDFENDRDSFSFSMLVLSSISTVCVMAVVIGINILFPNVFGLSRPLTLLMGVFLLSEPAYNMWSVRQRFEYKYRAQTILACLISIIAILVALFLVWTCNGSTLLARAFGYYGVLIVAYFAFYFYLGTKAKWQITFKYWKYALAFNLPLIPHYLSLYVLNHFDRIMIAGFLGDSAAAIYTLAYQLGSAGVIVWNAINASLIPYTYEKCRAEKFEALNKTTLKILCLYALVCLAVILAAPELIFIFAPSSYSESTMLVAPIVFGVFCSSLYYIFANVVYYYKQPKWVMLASCISAVLSIILNAIFIPIFGIAAAVGSTIVCYLIQALIDYWAMNKVVSKKIYSIKVVVLIASCVAAAAFALPLLYDYLILRILVAITGCLILFGFRNRIMSLLRKIK